MLTAAHLQYPEHERNQNAHQQKKYIKKKVVLYIRCNITHHSKDKYMISLMWNLKKWYK